MKSTRALSLVELLVVAAMMAVLTLAVAQAFVTAINLERLQAERQAQQSRTEQMEQRVAGLIRGAMLSADNGDNSTYFIGESESGDTELGADRLTFTTLAPTVPLATQESQDDFETQQQLYGPVGGLAEVSLGLSAVGDPGDRVGLFERIQRPADEDSTQGGRESVLDSEVETIGFEFFNGTDWGVSWDTVAGERRLPAAVRVNYIRAGDDSQTVRRFVVALPASDVDLQDPSSNGALQ